MEAQTQLPITKLSWYFLLAAIVFTTACHRTKKLVQIDPAFSKYIEAYTSGTVSKKTAYAYSLLQMQVLHMQYTSPSTKNYFHSHHR
ncbi:MAG: hypothetical protein QM541_02105 [Flavobacterium sp.]|nr:hypothetical protein [Flavobacterium sp.]